MRKHIGIVIILLGFAMLYFVQDEMSSQDLASISPHHEVTPKEALKAQQFNYHLYKTQQQMNAKSYKSYLQNSKTAPDLHEAPEQNKVDLKQHGIDYSQDKYEAQSAQRFDQKNEPDYFSPDYQIQTQLYEKQQLNQYNEAYKKAYADQFVENARKAGYQVKLDENFRVIGVKPIKKTPSIQDIKVIDSNQGAIQ